MNTYDLDLNTVMFILFKKFIFSSITDNEIVLQNGSRQVYAQQIIDDYFFSSIPTLLPVQFHYMLAKSGFDDVINPLLEAMKSDDVEKYATYKAYLTAARFYDFSKSYYLFTNVKAQIVAVNPALDFDLLTLKTMWLDATLI